MPKVPTVVSKRISTELPKFQKILSAARDRDVNEADTVVIVADILEAIFGYDKYTEITREYAIKGTFCDLAIKIGEKVDILIEVKAIGMELKDIHARQAINYGAQSGIHWVVLTNGLDWQFFKVVVDGQVSSEQFLNFNLLELSGRKAADQELLFSLCRRAIDKDVISELYEYKQSVNRYVIAALVQSDDVIST